MQNTHLNYYLVYKPPKDALKKLQMEKELSSLGCGKLHYSLWRIPKREIKKVLQITHEYEPLIFKRTRELQPSQINFDKEIYDLGSVAIIAYKLKKGENRKRNTVLRALRRSPRIKIGQSLYLIPYLKTSILSIFKGKVMLQDELFDLLKNEGIKAHRLTYMKIIYPSSHKSLLKMMMDHEILTCQKMTLILKRLMIKIERSEPQKLPTFLKILSAYNVRYKALKGTVFFLYNIMNIDLRFHLKKVYNSLILCKKMYNSKLLKINSMTD